MFWPYHWIQKAQTQLFLEEWKNPPSSWGTTEKASAMMVICLPSKDIHHYHKWEQVNVSTSLLPVTRGIGHFFKTHKLMFSLK